MTEDQEQLLVNFATLVAPYRLMMQPNLAQRQTVAHIVSEKEVQVGLTRRHAGDLLCIREQIPGDRVEAPSDSAVCSRCCDVARKFVLEAKFKGYGSQRPGLATYGEQSDRRWHRRKSYRRSG